MPEIDECEDGEAVGSDEHPDIKPTTAKAIRDRQLGRIVFVFISEKPQLDGSMAFEVNRVLLALEALFIQSFQCLIIAHIADAVMLGLCVPAIR